MDLDAFGHRLRVARRRQGMTQPQVASAVGVTPRQVWRWEKGLAQPRADSVYQLEDALGLGRGQLLAADVPTQTVAIDVSALAALRNRLLRLEQEVRELKRKQGSEPPATGRHRVPNGD